MKNLLLFLIFTLLACNNESTTQSESMNEKTYSQSELKKLIFPILIKEGVQYKKNKAVFAREANAGEVIQTITKDGLETTNTAEAGDFIVKNQTEAKEQYILESEEFHERYEYVDVADDGFSIYKPKGKIIALEMTSDILNQLEIPASFYFIAPWEEKMVVKENDFLVSPPDYSEIYRIARKEFFETYTKH